MEKILELKHITKTFGKIVANKDVSFELYKGEVLSLLGENGSGKTTLMNVISGVYHQDEGEILINDKKVEISSAKDAYKYKIGMVHQHFKLVDIMTATQNIILGLDKEYYESFYEEQMQVTLEKERELGTKEELKARIIELKAKLGALEETDPLKNEIENELKQTKNKYKTILGYYKKQQKAKHFSPELAKERIVELANKYSFIIDPDKKVYDMSVSEKQNLEIIKVLFRGADILILDEPTAVLTPQEIDKLFDAIRNLKAAGKSVIIITHKLNEVMEISDRVAVLRKGQHTGTVKTNETNEEELTEFMVGHKVDLNIARSEPVNPVERLFINNISVKDKDGVYKLQNVSLTARSGEILGIAGIAGSGQRELLEAVSGLVKLESGEIYYQNPKKDCPLTFYHHTIKQAKELSASGALYDKETKEDTNFVGMNDFEIYKYINNGNAIYKEDQRIDLKEKNPQQIRELGIRLSFVPEDRLGMGLVADMNLVDNVMLRSYRKGFGAFLHKENPETVTEKIVKDLEVATPNLNTPIRKLSGGNIQKILVGREIAYTPKVLMAAYPVRGLDINSSYTIYDLLNKQKERGTAVIFVGEDLDVLLALADRIAVICDGHITGVVDAKTTNKREIGKLMTKHEIGGEN